MHDSRAAALSLRARLCASTFVAGLALNPAGALPPTPDAVLTNVGGSVPTIVTSGNTQNVTLNAARTLLRYGDGYAITADETVNFRFSQRSDIAIIHNTASDSPTIIDGALNAFVGTVTGGNVWLLSSAGILFGNNARVDVGGLIASTAIPGNLTAASGGALDPLTLNFQFDQQSANGISIDAGAVIRAAGGTLAFIAPQISSAAGASITGANGASVLYGAVHNARIRFVRTASNDLDLIDFEVPTQGQAQFGTGLDLGGATSAGNIYLAAVSRSTVFGSIINATGTLTANSAANVNGDIVLSAGGGIIDRAPVRAPDGNFRIDANLGAVNAAGSLIADVTGVLTLGDTTSVGGSILANTAAITTQALTAGRDIIIRAGDAVGSTSQDFANGYGAPYGPAGGDIILNGKATAGDDIVLAGLYGNIETGSIALTGLGGDAAGDGHRLSLTAPGQITLGRAFDNDTLTGADAASLSGGSVRADLIGDVRLGSVSADTGNIDINVGVVQPVNGPVPDGNFSVDSVTARDGIRIATAGDATVGTALITSPGDVSLDISAGGAIDLGSGGGNYVTLTSQSAGIRAGRIAGDRIDLRASGDIEIGTLTFDFDPQGFGFRAAQISSDAGIRIGLGSGRIGDHDELNLSAGGAIDIDVLGNASLDSVTASSGSIKADAISLSALASDGSFAVTARAGGVTLANSRIAGDFSVTAKGGNAGLGDAWVAGALALTGDTVSLSRVAGIDGNVSTPLASIAITTTVGGLTLGEVPLNAGGDIRISSAGDLTINAAPAGYGYGYGAAPPSLAAGGDVSLSSTALLRIANGAGIATGRDLILAGQNIDTSAQSLSAARDVQVTAVVDARLGRVTASRDLLVDVTAGGITTTNDLTSQTGLISLKSTGDAFLIGASAATDLISNIGGSLQLGDGVSVSANRDLLLKAGGIDAGFGTMAAGRDAQLQSGAIALGTLTALGNITITADTLAYSSVTAQGSGLFDATVADTFDTRGTLNAGSIRIRGATLANEDSSGSMTAAAGIDIGVTGAARLGNLDGGSGGVSLTAGGALGIFGENRGTTLAYASTSGDITLADSHVTTSGAITLDALAGRIDTSDAGLTAATDISARAGTGLATGTLDASGNGRFETAAGDATLTTSRTVGDLIVRAMAGKAGLGSASVGGSLVLDGATISGTSLAGLAGPTAPLANITITASAGGYGLSGFALNASGDVSVSVRDDMALKSVGTINAGRDVTLHSGGLLTVNTGLTVGRDLVLGGGQVTTLGQPLSGTRDVTIAAIDTAQLGDIAAGRDLLVSGRDITASGAALTAAGTATLTGGAVDLGTLTTGGDIRIETGDLRYASITAQGSGIITVIAGGTIDTRGALTADTIGITAGTLANSDASGSMIGRGGITIAVDKTAALGNLDGGSGGVAVTSGDALGLFGSNRGTELRYTSTGGDITLAGSHGATASSLSVTALAGQIDSRTASLDAATDIVLRAGSATLGNATAGGALDFDVAGTLTLGRDRSLGAGAGIGFAAATIAGSGAFLSTAAGDIHLTSRSGSLVVGALDASRNVFLSSAGTLTAGSIGAARDISASGGDMSITSLDSGGSARLTINGTQGFLGSALTGGDLVIGGNGFDIGLGGLDIGGDFRLTTSGTVGYDAGGSARGSGNVDLIVGGAATLGVGSFDAGNLNIVAGGDVTLTSTGAVTLAAIDAGDDARVSGTTLAIADVFAGGKGSSDGEGDGFNILLTGTTLASRNLVAGTDVTTRISGESRLGDFTCPGMCRASSIIAGRDIDLGSGLFSLAPASGAPAITAGRDLIIRQTGAGSDLLLPTSLTGGGAVTLASDGGLVVGTLGIPGPVTLAARFIQIDRLSSGTASLTAGRIRIGELNIGTGTLGASATLAATGLASTDAVQVDRALVYGDLTLASAHGNAGLDSGAVAGRLSLSGATASLGPVTGVAARPYVQQLAIRTTSGDFVSKSALGADADIALDIAGAAELAGLAAGGNLTLLVGGQLRLDAQPVSAGGLVDIGAASILAGSSQIGAGDAITIASSGDATLGNVSAGTGSDSNLTITSGGILRFGGARLGVLDGGLAAGGRVAISAASIAGGNGDINAGEDIRLSATGSIAVDTVSAGDDLILAAADMRLVRGTARGDGPDSEGDGANIRLSGGAASAYYLGAQNDIIASLTGTLALGNPDCTGPLPCDIGSVGAGGMLRLSAGGFALADGFRALGTLTAGSDIVLTSATDLHFTGSIGAGRDVSITTSGALALGAVDAVNAVQLGSLDAISTGALRAGADIGISGNSHAIASSDSGGTTRLTSRADSSIGTVRSRNGLTVDGAAAVSIGDASIGGTVVINVGSGSMARVQDWQDGGSGYGGSVAPLQSLTVTTSIGDFRLGDSDASSNVRFDIAGSLHLTTLSSGASLFVRTGGALTADLLRSRAGLDVTAGGSVGIGAAQVGGTLSLTAASGQLDGAQGWRSVSGYGASVAPLQTLNITTTAGDFRLGSSDIAGAATLTSAGRLALAGLTAGGALDLRSGGDLDGGTSSGGAVTITSGGALTGSSVTAAGDLRADAGSIAVGRLAATGGTVTATASGRLAADTVMAGGDVILSGTTLTTAGLDAGRDLILTATAGDIAASGLVAVRDLRLTASGNIDGSNAGAGSSAALRAGGSIDLADLTTGGNGLLVASNGNITLAGTRIGGDLDVTADNGRAALTGLDIGNDLLVRAGTIDSLVTVGRSGQPLLQARDIRITALDGGILDADLTAARDISITSAGNVAVTRATAGQDIGISGSGGITIGTAMAQRDLLVTAAGDVRVDDARVGRDLSLSGALVGLTALGPVVTNSGTLFTRDISLVSTASAAGSPTLDFAGTLTASGTIRLDYASRITVGGLQAGGAIGITAMAANIGATSTADTVTLTGGTFSMSSVSAGRDIIIDVADLRGNSFSAGDDVDAVVKRASVGRITTTGLGPDNDQTGALTGANIRISGNALTFGTLAAANDVQVNVTLAPLCCDVPGQLFVAGPVQAGRDARLIADTISLNGGNAGRDFVATATAGLASTGTLAAGRDALLGGNGVTLARLTTGGDARLTSGAGVILTGSSIGNDLIVTAETGAVNLAGLGIGRDLLVRAGQIDQLTLTGQGPPRDMILAGLAGGITVDSLTVSRDLIVTAAGAVAAGRVSAGRDVRATGSGISVGDVIAGHDLSLDAGVAALSAGNLSAGDDVRLLGGTVTVGSVDALASAPDDEGDGSSIAITGSIVTAGDLNSRHDALVRANGALRVGAVTAGRDVTLSGLSLTSGRQVQGRAVTMTATGGALDSGGVTASGDLDLAAATLLTLTGPVRASGAGTLVAAALAITDAEAGTTLTLTARNGAINGGVWRAGGDLVANASGDIEYGSLGADGRATLIGANIRGGNVTAASADIAATAGVLLGIANTMGDFAVRGRSIAATSLSAGQDVLVTGNGAINIAGPIRAGRDLIAGTASGSLTTSGMLDAGRDIRLAANGIRVGAATAKGLVVADARDGALGIDNVEAGAGITLSGSNMTGGNLVSRGDAAITASGQVRIATASATSDFAITAASIDAGALSAGQDIRLVGTAPIAVNGQISAGRDLFVSTRSGSAGTTGALTAGRDIRVSGDGVSIGAASAGAALVADARGGALLIGDVTATGLVELKGDTVTSGTLRAGANASIIARNGVTLGTARAANDFAIVAGSIAAAALSAGQDVLVAGTAPISIDGQIDAARDIRVTTSSGSATTRGALTAGRDILVSGDGVGIGAATAGGAIRIAAGGAALRIDDSRAGDIIDLSGASVTGGALAAGSDATIIASGAVTLGTASAARDFAITAASIGAGALSAGQDVRLTGTAPIAIDGRISATRDIAITTSRGSATATGALVAGRNILITATGVSIGDATAGGDMTVAAGSGPLGSGTLTAGDDIILGGGAMTLGGLTATGLGADSEGDGGNIRITGAAVASGRLQAASDIIVTASGAASLGLGAGGSVIAGRDVRLAGASLATGPLVQGRDLALSSGGALTTGDLTSAGGLALAASGALATGNVRAAGDVGLAGSSVSAGAVTADGAATITTTGALTAGAITATGATLTGGAVTLAGVSVRDNIRITGASIGGALRLSGTDITLNASGEIAPLGSITARRDLVISAGNRIGYTDLSAGRDLSLSAPIIAGGRAFASRDLTIIATGSVTGTRFEAGRNLLIDPDQPIIADTVVAAGDATLIGASITVQTLDVGGRATLSATAGGIGIDAGRVTGSAQMVATGRITLGDWRSAALALLAGDLDVRRSLVAASLRVETPGPMVLGGSGTGNGFRLAAADIARLRIGGAAEFFAGTTGAITAAALPNQQPRSVAAAAGGTLTVEGFSYDPGALPVLNLFAGRGFDVNVTGRVAPTLNGGVIRIGDLAVDSLWRPGAILISGGFGSAELAVDCFGDVIAVNSLVLLAVNDVVFGSAEFASAVRATAPDAIDVGAGVPAVTGPADNRLFAVATQLRVDAGSRIVSQNSAAVAGGYVGLLIGGEGATGSNGIVQINGAARVDLTGSLVLPNAGLRSGPNVALITGLNAGSIAGSFSFNGCAVGAAACGGGGTTPAEIMRIEDYVVPTPGLLVPPAPSVTVLGIDNQLNDTVPVAIGTGDGTIIIRRRATP